MEIIIPLPQFDDTQRTYQGLRSYLKQLELAVHHAQKSVESAEKEKVELSDDCYVNFSHPLLEQFTQIDSEKDNNGTLKNIVDNYYSELQFVELHINLI